jgi:NADH:ubiquinone oxidoreductase subunit 2 (subunit N)
MNPGYDALWPFLAQAAGPTAFGALVAAGLACASVRPFGAAHMACVTAALISAVAGATAYMAVLMGPAAASARAEAFLGLVLTGASSFALTAAPSVLRAAGLTSASAPALGLMLLGAAGLHGVVLFAAGMVAGALAYGGAMLCLLLGLATAERDSKATIAAALTGLISVGLTLSAIVLGAALEGAAFASALGLALCGAGLVAATGAAPGLGPQGVMLSGGRTVSFGLMAPSVLAAGAAMALRLAQEATGAPAALVTGLSLLMVFAGGVGCVIAALQTIGARDLRGFIASAVGAQAGMGLIGIGLFSSSGAAAALMHMITLCAAGVGLACALVACGGRDGAGLDALVGLGRRRPLAGACFAVCCLSLMGAPLTIGFLSKWLLIEAALGAGYWAAAGAIVVSSIAMIVPIAAMLERIYFTSPDPDAADHPRPSLALAPAQIGACALALGLGLNAVHAVDWATFAASALSGGGR